MIELMALFGGRPNTGCLEHGRLISSRESLIRAAACNNPVRLVRGAGRASRGDPAA